MTTSRRVHLHFLQRHATVIGMDEFHDWDVQAVYRAVGYFGSPLADLPFDEVAGVMPNVAGRVVTQDGAPLPRLYTTGWIKRGPVGLIGSTKSDARETIGNVIADSESAGDGLRRAGSPDPQAVLDLLEERGVPYTNWDGWQRIDAHELSLGEGEGRERIKVVPREELTAIALAKELARASTNP